MTDTSPAARWKLTLAPYVTPSWGRGALALATSLVPYLALAALMVILLPVSPWITIALMPLAAGFLLRTCSVFHDCCHGSLLPSRRANQVLGVALGLVVVTPFAAWRHSHAIHHGSAGDIDRRGGGDVETWTVREYRAASPGRRLYYRAIRNPVVLLIVGPLASMIIGPRLVHAGMRARVRTSILALDLALLLVIAVLGWAIGPLTLLIIWLPVAMLAGAGGVWLFFVQHQFEDSYWSDGESWDYFDAALRGSSYLRLPALLAFFTANIGFHHVHHLNARVPHYNLARAHQACAQLRAVPELTLRGSLGCFRLKLIDERTGRLISFADARRHVPVQAVGAPAV